ncbi:MAG: tripartite tricarboxylate transporter TctB family protein [Geminicoccaceae bacterium]
MSDRVFGLIIIAVALGFIASATQIQVSFLTDPVGPKTFPYLIGGVLIVSALSLILKPDTDPDWPPLLTYARLAITVLVLICYAYALRPLGFLAPTALAAGIISYQISPRPVNATLTGLGLAVGLFVIFKYALDLGLVAFPKF